MHQQHYTQEKTKITSTTTSMRLQTKPLHNSDGRLQCSNREKKPMETATGKFGFGLRNDRGDTLGEWATSRKCKIQTDPKEVPEITSREVEAALPDMKNGTGTGNDHINIETLKAGEDTFSKILAKLYTKMLI